ncbi:MAG: DUF559 domain-containing protein, partial [Promethearchaeia archaeon]
MVWYYCEFCNKNIQVSEGVIKCKNCGHLLYPNTITQEERKRRDRERTTYCEYCDKMEYAVPIQIVILDVQRQRQLTLHSIKNPPKPVLKIKDGRYKSGYRLTEEGEKIETLYCILFFLTIITLGLALIPIVIYYHFKNKKENNKIQAKLDLISTNFGNVLQNLHIISENYSYVCRRCYNGVNLGVKESLTVKKFHLIFNQMCFKFQEPKFISEEMRSFTNFLKKHLILTIFCIIFIIDMFVGVSLGNESPIYNITIIIGAIMILFFIPILIIDIFIAKKIKTKREKLKNFNKTQKIIEFKKREEELRIALENMANTVNSLSDNAFLEYKSGNLKNAINIWEKALSLLTHYRNTIKGINSYANYQINRMANQLKINIRNVNKSINENKQLLSIETTNKIYCEMCGSENEIDKKFCINCGTKLRINDLKIKIQDKLIEKCESPIEEQFFRIARQIIPNIEPQVQIGHYRVDFAVMDKKVVVELDGHNYHKTKEQRTYDAERQRYLQKNGFTVVRFTGSEINKDVNGCVSELLDILDKK